MVILRGWVLFMSEVPLYVNNFFFFFFTLVQVLEGP